MPKKYIIERSIDCNYPVIPITLNYCISKVLEKLDNTAVAGSAVSTQQCTKLQVQCTGVPIEQFQFERRDSPCRFMIYVPLLFGGHVQTQQQSEPLEALENENEYCQSHVCITQQNTS
jgi:hypothetical protein